MLKFSPRSLSAKVTLALSVGLVVVFALLAGFMTYGIRDEMYRISDEKHMRILSLQANSAAIPLWTFNSSQMQAIVDTLIQSEEVHSAEILDTTGDVQASARQQETMEEHSHRIVQQDIIYTGQGGSQNLGVLKLELDYTAIIEHVTFLTLRMLAMVSAIFAVLLAVVYVVSKRAIAPISHLSQLMMTASVRDDIEMNHQNSRVIEVRRLYSALSQMRHAYHAYQDNLTLEKEKAEQARDEANKANQLKSEFLANMSHEIRTPMNGVMGLTDLLLMTEMTPEQKDYAQTIRKSADALHAVINDVLDFSKLDQGALSLEPVRFDLYQVVGDVMELFSPTADTKGLNMMLRYEPGAPIYVVGDDSRIRQVLSNLVNNAIKFTQKGHILVEVAHTLQENGVAHFTFSVTDTGVGIKEDAQEAIFDRFRQEDGSTTRRFGGTGLGLSISKQLVELMKGKIGLKSQVKEGSTFWFTVPLTLDDHIETVENKRITHATLQGHHILLVEDNPVHAKIIEEELTYLQASCTVASSAEEALAVLEQEGPSFHAAVIDYKLPGMDGLALGKRIREHEAWQGIPLVACSSVSLEEGARSFEAEGFHGYIPKPVYGNALAHMLLAVIYRKQDKKKIITRHMLRKADVHNQDENEVKTVEVKAEEAAPKHAFKVLVAEDDRVNQKVVERLIHTFGGQAVIAENGREAVTAFKEHTFDVVLMDLQMPEMDGLEATLSIRAYETEHTLKKTPIIAFTANATTADRERCMQVGMDDFMSKPMTMGKFKTYLLKWVEELKEMKAL